MQRSALPLLLPITVAFAATFGFACGTDDAADDDPGAAYPGLSADVEVIVDDMGIPHIYGETDKDVFHAAGYHMAKERLFMMDLTLRRGKGTRAEVLGDGFLGGDRLARLIDFPRWARLELERLWEETPADMALVVAWTAGVNRYIEEIERGETPMPYGYEEAGFEPERWETVDPMIVAMLLVFGNDNSLERELLATVLRNNFPDVFAAIQLLKPLYPVYTVPEELRPTPTSGAVPPAPVLPDLAGRAEIPADVEAALRRLRETMSDFDVEGSNNWAVAAEHSANGKPLIAGDPHQPLDSPSIFYVQHLNSKDAGGSLDVMGWAFAGAPGVHLGHNDRIAWTATTNFPDTMDLWEVPKDGDAIQIGDSTEPIHEREEIIRVRKRGEDGTLLDAWDEVTYVVRDVGDGYGMLLDDNVLPLNLVKRDPTNEVLFRWTGFEGTMAAKAFFGMDRASTLDAYEEAVDQAEAGAWNFIAADESDITYRVNLKVPDRGDPTARPMPWTVADGTDPGTVWNGEFLPPEMLPRAENPSQGFITTANNDPWGFTGDGTVENDPWYYGSFYAVGFRARRLEDELTRLVGEGDLTVEDMQTLQLDTHSPLADDLLPMLEEAWTADDGNERSNELRADADLGLLVDVLRDWDRRMDRESAGALAFHLVALFATERTTSDDFSFLYDTILDESTTYLIKVAVLAMQDAYPDSQAILDKDRAEILLGALADAAVFLKERFGGVDPTLYAWGDMHGTYFDNPFGGELEYGFVPTDGGEDTVNVSGSRFLDDGEPADRFESGSGPIYRAVMSFADDGTPELHANFPLGNSGDPSSPHFDDLLDAWVEGEYRKLPFRRGEVEAAEESRYTLSAE